jgi:hypothetical protein
MVMAPIPVSLVPVETTTTNHHQQSPTLPTTTNLGFVISSSTSADMVTVPIPVPLVPVETTTTNHHQQSPTIPTTTNLGLPNPDSIPVNPVTTMPLPIDADDSFSFTAEDLCIRQMQIDNEKPWAEFDVYPSDAIVRFEGYLFKSVPVGDTVNMTNHPIDPQTMSVSHYWARIIMIPNSVAMEFKNFCDTNFYTSEDPFMPDVRAAVEDLCVRVNDDASTKKGTGVLTDGSCQTSAPIRRFQNSLVDKEKHTALSHQLREMVVRTMSFNCRWLDEGIKCICSVVDPENSLLVNEVETSLDPRVADAIKNGTRPCIAYINTFRSDTHVQSDELTLAAMKTIFASQGWTIRNVSDANEMPSLWMMLQPKTAFLTKNKKFTNNLDNHWTSFGVFYAPTLVAPAAKRVHDDDSAGQEKGKTLKKARGTEGD